jgi:ATP-dependent HslUV protease ATP-binding subunit HslU
LKEVFGNIFQGKPKKDDQVPEALELLFQEESKKLIDKDKVVTEQ